MFCYLYFFSFMLYFFLQKIFFHKISNRTHLNNRSFDNKSDTIPTHWSKQCSSFKTSLNSLHINRLRQKPPRRQARICDFCILYGPKYRHFFLITQARYNVNSPRRGFLKRAKHSSKGKFLPKTYINLVMAASVVISYADSTPAAKRRWPVS